jgi:hypothetical protein
MLKLTKAGKTSTGNRESFNQPSTLQKSYRRILGGCEPSVLYANEDYLDMQMGLSQRVQAAVDEAVKMVDSLVEQLLTRGRSRV